MIKLIRRNSFTILICALSYILMFVLINQLGPVKDKDYLKVSINQGDTVWQLAEEYSDEHRYDSLSFVKWVEKNNRINANEVVPGQEIFIPVKK